MIPKSRDVKGIEKQRKAQLLGKEKAKRAEEGIIVEELENLFTSLGIEDVAWISGFYKRKPKKISGTALFMSVLECLHEGNNDLGSLALGVGSKMNTVVDSQSISERFTERSVEFAKKLLENCLSTELKRLKTSKENSSASPSLFSGFTNVLLSRSFGSTCEGLPSSLRDVFPSSYSKTKAKSTVRIQCIYNY